MDKIMVIAREIMEYFSSLNVYDIVFLTANILLMLLLVTFIYVLKIKDNKEDKIDAVEIDNSDISLNVVVRSDLTKFENEEETKAIISYDELVNTQSIPVLKYKEEEEIEGLLVKAIDVNNLIETMDPKPISHPASYNVNKTKRHTAISDSKEEEFLLTLKKLESMVNKEI